MQVKGTLKPVNGGINTFVKVQEQNLGAANLAFGHAILGLANIFAPELTGALKSDGRVETIESGVQVVFGDGRVPYARKRHFENKKNPQTLNYLERAGDQRVKEGIAKYL